MVDINDVMGKDGLIPMHVDHLWFLVEEEFAECLAVGLNLDGGSKYIQGKLDKREFQ